MDDRLCIEQVLQGDSKYFAPLVDKYKQMAFSVALSILKDTFLAEEVVQESFISAYKHLKSFSFKSSFSTWLYTIVMRQCYKHYKKKKKIIAQDIESVQDDEHYPLSHYQQELEKIAVEEKHKLLEKAILALSEIEQVCIKLFYMDDKSIKEIGEILNLSIPNIKVTLHRARKKLYQHIEIVLTSSI